MYDSIYDFIRSAKYVSIFILMALSPGETVMPLAGYVASGGSLWLPGAIVAGAAGSSLGSIAIYGLGRLVSPERLNEIVRKYGRILGVNHRNIDKAGRLFDRYSWRAVFLSRFVPGIRTAVSIPAGVRRMPFQQFLLFTFLGNLVCSGILAYLGYIARDRIAEIHAIITSVSTFIYLVLLTFVIAFVFWRLQKSQN
jgi:membrane protein DedA with SNARE-associated domain